jgi:hypothetical protein
VIPVDHILQNVNELCERIAVTKLLSSCYLGSEEAH